ncbi:MAG: hypothetical protein EPN91_08655 [Salinibacterium sp.]|nr:MAG: hypothetical protein EPN91_08655 [Salinibacterium sp.]
MKKRVTEPAPNRRIVLFVDETMFVEDRGFRPVFVVDGEVGFRQNGDWPYEGKVGQKMPWFFGPTIEDAREACRLHNERLGIDQHEALMIVARCMARGARR